MRVQSALSLSSAICTPHRATQCTMTTEHERLRKIRLDRGYTKAVDAAKAMGVNRYTYAQHENGTRGSKGIPRESSIRYARFYRVSLEWLVTGRGPRESGPTMVPISHFVGAGAEILPIDNAIAPSDIKESEIDAPPGVDDCIAAEIKGDSMYPLGEHWVIFYANPPSAGVREDCVGKLCIVQIENGSLLVKMLRRGNRKGLWTLESWNAATREDVRLAWAAPVLDIRPRYKP